MSAEPMNACDYQEHVAELTYEFQTRIAELKRQLAEARAALEPFARHCRAIGSEPGPFRLETFTGWREIPREHFDRARAVLSPAEDKPPASRGEPKGG